jgi:hypothetical protein
MISGPAASKPSPSEAPLVIMMIQMISIEVVGKTKKSIAILENEIYQQNDRLCNRFVPIKEAQNF